MQDDLQEFGRLSAAGLTWRQARDRLADWWPVPEVLAALAEAPEGVPDEVSRWLNPIVCRILGCD